MSCRGLSRILPWAILMIGSVCALESWSDEPPEVQKPAADSGAENEARQTKDNDAPTDDALPKLGPIATVSVKIYEHRPGDSPWRSLEAVVRPNGSGALRLLEHNRTKSVRKVQLDDDQRIDVLRSALETLDNFNLMTSYFEDGTDSTFNLSAGSGSITVQTTRANPCEPIQSIARTLNENVPVEERLPIGTHRPKPHESQMRDDRLRVRRTDRRLIDSPLEIWDVSLRIRSPDGKVVAASVDQTRNASVQDDLPDGSGRRTRRKPIQRQKEAVRDVALKCFEEYALIPPRELPANADGKTGRCEMRLGAYGKSNGEIERVSSISLSERDFEGNDSFSKNVHEFLRTLTAAIESPPAGGLGETSH